MVIEFNTVRTDEEEMNNRAIQAHKIKEMGMDIESLAFHNEHDWVAKASLEMDDVVDWTEGRVFINQIEAPCVFARLSGGLMTSAILTTYEDFTRVFEKCRNTQVLTVDKFLNKK